MRIKDTYLLSFIGFLTLFNGMSHGYTFDGGRCLRSGEQPECTVLRSCKFLKDQKLVGYLVVEDKEECKATGLKVLCAYK